MRSNESLDFKGNIVRGFLSRPDGPFLKPPEPKCEPDCEGDCPICIAWMNNEPPPVLEFKGLRSDQVLFDGYLTDATDLQDGAQKPQENRD